MSSIPEDWSSLAAINSEFQELLKKLPPKFQIVKESTTVESLRAFGDRSPPSEKWPGVLERDIMVKMRDGYENCIRSYVPENAPVKGPLLVMVFGGGFCIGKLENVEKDCRNWVKTHGGSAVSISHRLAPEAKFPVPTDDCYDALKWVRSSLRLPRSFERPAYCPVDRSQHGQLESRSEERIHHGRRVSFMGRY
jgi:acetyl esterase/lipase